MHTYDPSQIEPKWQQFWQKNRCFEVSSDPKVLKSKPKYYVLDMFPYPSGAGLHVGHPEGYTATDVVARFKRMQGFNVMHPMGWDAFGLPAERAAMRDNLHPAIITKRNVDNFRRQIQSLGFSYDWSREIDTSSADYYRWTQWIFLKLYEKNLAYTAEVPVNWCPALGTVLANEEVKDGKYVETGDPVERRLMRQWMLRITAYAERLLDDLALVDWPDGVKEMQREWIGKSEGTEITFAVDRSAHGFKVFTTRPDTLFGVTYVVLAPEHPLVNEITVASHRSAVERYLAEVKNKTDLQRTDLARDKSGAFTGSFAVHPLTGEKLPIWIADYVLASYGTGAVMAVPAHDERDHAFAKIYRLPVREVVRPESGAALADAAFTGPGVLIASGEFDGVSNEDAKKKISARLEQKQMGRTRVTYRLRDWLFSRQRYWGEPIPVLHLADGGLEPVASEDLPILLPAIDEYRPTADGKPPLARAGEDWLNVTLPDGRGALRETNTMPQWAGSCWYYLRYLDPKNTTAPFSEELEKYWMPVDLYIGGVEHAVLHLLYARFWHKVLFDCGLVHTKEPFQKLFNQGMILGQSFRDGRGKYYGREEVEERGGAFFNAGGDKLETQIEKMSKSRYNVVNPDDVIREYGADAMRLYELFMGPLEQTKPWKMDGVEGVARFLARVWRLSIDDRTGTPNPRLTDQPGASDAALWSLLHKTIQKVTQDTDRLCFNTAISQMMIFVNEATARESLPREIVLGFLKTLNPYAPHITEEIWERLGQRAPLSLEAWPAFDPKLVQDAQVTVIVQVNGKLRDRIDVERGTTEAELEQRARACEKVAPLLAGQTPKRVVVVKDRLVNFVL